MLTSSSMSTDPCSHLGPSDTDRSRSVRASRRLRTLCAPGRASRDISLFPNGPSAREKPWSRSDPFSLPLTTELRAGEILQSSNYSPSPPSRRPGPDGEGSQPPCAHRPTPKSLSAADVLSTGTRSRIRYLSHCFQTCSRSRHTGYRRVGSKVARPLMSATLWRSVRNPGSDPCLSDMPALGNSRHVFVELDVESPRCRVSRGRRHASHHALPGLPPAFVPLALSSAPPDNAGAAVVLRLPTPCHAGVSMLLTCFIGYRWMRRQRRSKRGEDLVKRTVVGAWRCACMAQMEQMCSRSGWTAMSERLVYARRRWFSHADRRKLGTALEARISMRFDYCSLV